MYDEFVDQNGKGGSSLDDKWAQNMEQEFENLRNEFIKFRDETNNNLKNVNDTLPRKADKEDLNELEQRLLERINEMLKKLLGSFADKNDTKKRLTNLEKNVRDIH
jgi:hypothetical protein